MKLYSHAVRIGIGGPVRDVRYSSRIRESHRRWDRAAVEKYGSAKPGCLGRSLEVAFDNDALGVISTKAWMGTKYLVLPHGGLSLRHRNARAAASSKITSVTFLEIEICWLVSALGT